MLRVVSIAAAICLGCSASAPQAKQRTLPEPLVAAKLPPSPKDEAKVPPSADWAAGVDGYWVARPDGTREDVDRPGICMSMEKATRAAHYVIGYDELRALYEVDLRTWGRERKVYERYVQLAQDEADRQTKLAERSWWERNSPGLALGFGIVVGAAVTVGIAAAIEEVSGP